MWKLTKRYDLGSDDDRINLIIPRNCCFKVCNTYFLDYDWDGFSTNITAVTYIDEDDENKALIMADSQMTEGNEILNFLYGTRIHSGIISFSSFIKTKEVKEVKEEQVLNGSRNLRRIKLFDSKLCLLENSLKKVVLGSIHYYSRAWELYFLELYDEAFLCLFKSVEIIS